MCKLSFTNTFEKMPRLRTLVFFLEQNVLENQQRHEIYKTCHSVTFYFLKKLLFWYQEVPFSKYDLWWFFPNHILQIALSANNKKSFSWYKMQWNDKFHRFHNRHEGHSKLQRVFFIWINSDNTDAVLQANGRGLDFYS